MILVRRMVTVCEQLVNVRVQTDQEIVSQMFIALFLRIPGDSFFPFSID